MPEAEKWARDLPFSVGHAKTHKTTPGSPRPILPKDDRPVRQGQGPRGDGGPTLHQRGHDAHRPTPHQRGHDAHRPTLNQRGHDAHRPTPHQRGHDADRQGEPDPGWSARPVVLVHGILGQELFYWNFLKRRLVANGLDVQEVSLPNLALGDLREAALSLRGRLLDTLEALETTQVDVVAHSAGGLVTRYCIKRLLGDPVVRRLVTLGTPHAGTRTANLLPEVGMVAQVRPGSAFLEELNEDDPTPGPTRYTAYWTPFDGVVVPAESARLPEATNVENVLYPGITHWGYLFGPRIARILSVDLRVGFIGGERSVDRRTVLEP